MSTGCACHMAAYHGILPPPLPLSAFRAPRKMVWFMLRSLVASPISAPLPRPVCLRLAIGIFVAFTKVQRRRAAAADKSHEIITRVTVNAVKLPPL